jgi:hypothetical protein
VKGNMLADKRPGAGRWRRHWYEVQVLVGADLREKSLDDLDAAIRRASWDGIRSMTAEPAVGGGALVTAVVKARHAGEAAAVTVELLALAAAPEWDAPGAEVQGAARVPQGIRRWPRLAVNPELGEAPCAEAARTLAEAALRQSARPPAEDLLELLQAVGLTVTATEKETGNAGS